MCLLGALLSPLIGNRDSLPLSTYPMYATSRSNVTSFVTASGLDEMGDRMPLSAPAIAESRDPLIAQSFLNDTVQRGTVAELCAEIALRVDGGVVSIEIATERHDTTARLRGEESLQGRDVHITCEVPR